MPEAALFGMGFSPVHGLTLNPVNRHFTASGSSSGTAVAIAGIEQQDVVAMCNIGAFAALYNAAARGGGGCKAKNVGKSKEEFGG